MRTKFTGEGDLVCLDHRLGTLDSLRGLWNGVASRQASPARPCVRASPSTVLRKDNISTFFRPSMTTVNSLYGDTFPLDKEGVVVTCCTTNRMTPLLASR